MKAITKLKIKNWCFVNVLIPGLAVLSINASNNDTSECHAPPPWYTTCLPFVAVVSITVLVAAVFGVVILVKHVRRKKALKRQLEKGIITKQQYLKMK